MTLEEFRYIVDTKKEYEFTYRGISYSLTYGRNEPGFDVIEFGERFFQRKFDSWGMFINEAKVENHYLREMLDILPCPKDLKKTH